MKRVFPVLLCVIMLLAVLPVPSGAEGTAPVIDTNPANYSFPAGSTAVWYCEAGDGSEEFYGYHWYLIYEGVTYDTASEDIDTAPWYGFGDPETGFGIGPMENSYIITGIQEGLNGAEIFCVAENKYGRTESAHALISVGESWMFRHADNMDIPAWVSCVRGETVTLNCSASSTDEAAGPEGMLSQLWYQSADGELPGIIAVNRGSEIGPTLTVDTTDMEPGEYYYYCGCTIGEGSEGENRSYSGLCVLTVEEAEYPLSIEIQNAPDKKLYNEGEYVDLEGMTLRVWTNKGFYALTDLSEVTASPDCLYGAGKHMVTVTYLELKTAFEVEVLAPEPELPVIDVQPSGGVYTMGEKTPALSVKAHSPDSGKLTYVWYYCYDGAMDSLRAIDGTDMSVFSPPQEEGSKYYCVGIRNNLEDRESEPVYSGLVKVTFEAAVVPPAEPEPDPKPEPQPEPEPDPEQTQTPPDSKLPDGSAEPEAGKNGDQNENAGREQKAEQNGDQTSDKNGNKSDGKKEHREEKNEKVSGWVWAFIVAAVLLIGTAAALVVILVKRRDRAEEEE